MKTRTTLELSITAIVFALLVLAGHILPGSGIGLSGNAILNEDGSLQASVQEILREDIFALVGASAKFCININDNGNVTHSYKVRKIGDVFRVEQSGAHCEGAASEDLDFTFKSYDSFAAFRAKPKFSTLGTGKARQDFAVEKSKYVKADGLVLCDDDFKQKYCSAIGKELSKYEEKKFGLGCCLEPAVETPSSQLKPKSELTAFVIKYIWVIAILAVCLSLGAGSILLLSGERESERQGIEKSIDEELKTGIDYVAASRKRGHADSNIQKSMRASGWDEEDIDEIFEIVRRKDLSSLGERFVRG